MLMLKTILAKLGRIHAFFDKSAWLLILPAMLIIYWVDPVLAQTLWKWSLFGVVLSGVAVIISRLIFPQLNLGELMKRVEDDTHASGVVVAALIIFVGILMLALVIWAKA